MQARRGGLTAGGGDLASAGEGGGPGLRLANAATGGVSGNGGSSPFGGGAVGRVTAGVGNAASGYGAGGSGGVAGGTSQAGGAGSGGLVIVYEFR